MDLSIDVDCVTKHKKCPSCKSKYLYMQRFLLDRNDPYAAVFIEGHRHSENPELFFTAIIGTWNNSDDTSDHVTFSCRYGEVEGRAEPACTLIDAPETFEESIAGKRLTRVEGLAHPKLNEFWGLVDFLMEYDISIHDFLHHPLKSKLKTIFHY